MSIPQPLYTLALIKPIGHFNCKLCGIPKKHKIGTSKGAIRQLPLCVVLRLGPDAQLRLTKSSLQTNLSHAITFIPFYPVVILIKHRFPINFNSISIISRSFLSMSISISITKTGPYQYQYLINFSKFSLSISIPISISQIFLINISLSMHCAALT